MAAKSDKVQLSLTHGLLHRVLVTQPLQTMPYRIRYQEWCTGFSHELRPWSRTVPTERSLLLVSEGITHQS